MVSKKVYTFPNAYMTYPYKQMYIRGNKLMRGHVYVKKAEHSNHKYALPYLEWMNIMRTYVEEVVQYLMIGRDVKLPYAMGLLRMKKIKNRAQDKKFINWNETIKRYGEINKTLPKGSKKKVYHTNIHTNKYAIVFRWHKNYDIHPFFRYYKFRLVKTARKRISHYIKSDIDAINYISI